ncbi:MAG: hypothetical protein IKG79_07250 [Neisseriaceae bacterium]|nr:hypothetical protein [Neisseriaceae bacterium]
MIFSELLNKFKSNWRTITPIFLVVTYFCSFKFFPEYSWAVLVCSFVFSVAVLISESKNITTVIKDNILVSLSITFLVGITYFSAKVNATDHFNTKYGIYAEYLNYSITAWAVIVSAIFLILISSLILFICFFIQMKEEEEKQTTKVFKFFELLAHSFSCMLVSFCFVPVLQTIDKHDKVLLYLDAYTHSDCQAPKNNIAIRMDNETCYLFKFNAILFELELKKHSSKKNR